MDKSYIQINNYLDLLKKSKSKRELLDTGISLANEIMHLLGVSKNELLYGEDALDNAFENSKFGNQKIEQWFEKHPYMGTARIALYHYKGSLPVESNFFQLNESVTKAKISAITQLSSNWEDSTLTMIPNYKVGVDFFLSSDASSLKLIITNQGNLRILELSERLNNTQIEIFENIKGCFLYDGIDSKTGNIIPYEPQRTIHRTLWNSFEIQQVNKKFYNGVADHFVELYQHIVLNPPNQEHKETIKNESRLFASRLLGRLLFLWFLKKKNIINPLMEYFDINEMSSTHYYERNLKKLFFDVLNTPLESRNHSDSITPYLNGGLFEPHMNDWIESKVSFPENWFNTLYAHFNRFNFTTDESTPDYEQVAIDPEMLGRVFENLLASIRPETEEAANERSKKGTFYTPREIVSFMNQELLKEYLKTHINNLKDEEGINKLIEMNDARYLENKSTGLFDLWGTRTDDVRRKILKALDNLKVLDPAVGSGAFPIGMMQLLVKTYERLSAIYDPEMKAHRVALSSELTDLYLTKLSILKRNLYGVDIEPMAIEIARLRSWLSLIVDDKGKIEPLPNLDFNLVCTNSLIPLDNSKYQISIFDNFETEESFEVLRNDFFDEHDKEHKLELKKRFKMLYEKNSDSNDGYKRINQLSSWNPFETSKPALFFDPKTMFNIEEFDVVFGNPPYIHFEDIREESRELYKPLKYQTYEARGDIYTLFYERGINILKENGHLCFITSNKWMRAGYGKNLRNYLLNNTHPKLLIDLGSGVFESATVDTNIILIQKSDSHKETIAITLENGKNINSMIENLRKSSINITFKLNQPWNILHTIEQDIKLKIERYGVPLKDWMDIKINYGIKTGFNEAFIIDDITRQRLLDDCLTNEERTRTDEIIRPLLRGKDIKQRSVNWSKLFIILSHFGMHKEIEIKYPSIFKHLSTYEVQLSKRGQCRYKSNGNSSNVNDPNYPGYPGMHHWLELDNNPSKQYLDSFQEEKIVFSRITGGVPAFCLDNQGYYLNDTSYAIVGGNLNFLIDKLTSDLYWFSFLRFYMGGGIENEFKVNNLMNLPIPLPNTPEPILTDDEIMYIKDFLEGKIRK